MENIGDNIRSIRKEKGLSMNDVAAKVGLTYPGYQQIEKGRNTTIEKIWKIAEILEVSPSKLLGFGNDIDSVEMDNLKGRLKDKEKISKYLEKEVVLLKAYYLKEIGLFDDFINNYLEYFLPLEKEISDIENLGEDNTIDFIGNVNRLMNESIKKHSSKLSKINIEPSETKVIWEAFVKCFSDKSNLVDYTNVHLIEDLVTALQFLFLFNSFEEHMNKGKS
ncbi:helix-turn-helix transcriptional regulator [Flammeovirgaceae bacterium SG7u.111]|nr:helix-turn-helix transcriptional regulator [Flammeovirgaceae bacterium SG7u.132]WPO34630.1 helix-turn-helix transcriptional regulator [Flammeovirgaceae bacterium SG7u.111]